MPPAGGEARGEMRATVGRLAHERFTDERVAALLAEAAPRDELEADIVRVARRDFDKASARARRARGRDGPRRRGRARRLDAGARGQRLRTLRAVPGAQHRAAPALQRVLPRGRAPLRPAARRLRAGHDHGRGARGAAPAARRPRAARGLGPRHRRQPAAGRPVRRGRPARAAGHRAARDRRRRGAVAPRRGDPPVRGDDRHDGRAPDHALRRGRHGLALLRRCTSSGTASTSTRSTPPWSARRSPAAPRAPGTSRRAGCGRTWSAARAASGAGACPTRRPPSPSASPA